MGVFAVMSGYLVPLELLPRWIGAVADYLPFRYMLGFPVEVMTGMADRTSVLRGLGVQALMIAGLLGLSTLVWRAGIKRFEAYGA
jgi:ABC-2 type transport system permease protein